MIRNPEHILRWPAYAYRAALDHTLTLAYDSDAEVGSPEFKSSQRRWYEEFLQTLPRAGAEYCE